MVREFRSEDKGKPVVTADGDMIGTIQRASGSSARLEPDENLSRSIRRRLGWTEEETYRLEISKVERTTSDEVRLKQNPS